MRLRSNVVGVIALVVIFGGIILASSVNMWETTSSKEPAKYLDGEYAGEYNPEDIRGSYSFKDVTNAFGVPVDILAKAFGVEDWEDTASFQLKNLESIYEDLATEGKEIGTGSVRIFVALYKGLPIELSDEDYLPIPASEILKDKGDLSDEHLMFLETNSVDVSRENQGELVLEEDNFKETEEEHLEEIAVKGKTTFSEVIEWGIPSEKVEEIIGGSIPAPGMTIRDYCTENGISFSEIKDKLNELLS